MRISQETTWQFPAPPLELIEQTRRLTYAAWIQPAQA